ncbi:MAG: prepilin-type N-terminal cleavage/methylation domain-containing protein [Spirochaetales bacterium]|nr:prepilin-type N-terminal cleavage/methylation domain-containing protein [Spirochaetales bacterium]
MNLIRYHGFLSKKKHDGFTLMEVLVAMTIMSILGFTVWMGFAVAVNLIHAVPQTIELMQEFIALDSILREHISRVKPPFWLPELDYYIDSTTVTFPYYEGEEEQYLQIEFIDNYLYLSTNAKEKKEEGEEEETEETDSEELRELYHAGPFTYVYFNEVSEKELGLIGLEITLKPEHEKIEEFVIFARIGGHVFEKP